MSEGIVSRGFMDRIEAGLAEALTQTGGEAFLSVEPIASYLARREQLTAQIQALEAEKGNLDAVIAATMEVEGVSKCVGTTYSVSVQVRGRTSISEIKLLEKGVKRSVLEACKVTTRYPVLVVRKAKGGADEAVSQKATS